MNAALILAIVEKILIYGPPAVLIIAEILKANLDITPEDIRELKIDKNPADYF